LIINVLKFSPFCPVLCFPLFFSDSSSPRCCYFQHKMDSFIKQNSPYFNSHYFSDCFFTKKPKSHFPDHFFIPFQFIFWVFWLYFSHHFWLFQFIPFLQTISSPQNKSPHPLFQFIVRVFWLYFSHLVFTMLLVRQVANDSIPFFFGCFQCNWLPLFSGETHPNVPRKLQAQKNKFPKKKEPLDHRTVICIQKSHECSRDSFTLLCLCVHATYGSMCTKCTYTYTYTYDFSMNLADTKKQLLFWWDFWPPKAYFQKSVG
jgi:hypothetical protein